MDIPFGEESRFNVQFFQRFYSNHDPDIIPRRVETGGSVFVSTKLTSALSAEVLFVSSLNRVDWMLRPKLVWGFAPNWRAVAGIDAFGVRRPACSANSIRVIASTRNCATASDRRWRRDVRVADAASAPARDGRPRSVP